MTTHIQNIQPNTSIEGSTIEIGVLNINKTPTQAQIESLLPQYFTIDATSHFEYGFSLDPSVNLDLSSLFKVFINGVLIPTSLTLEDEGVYLFPLGTEFKVIGNSYTNLIDQPGVTMHALYTPANGE